MASKSVTSILLRSLPSAGLRSHFRARFRNAHPRRNICSTVCCKTTVHGNDVAVEQHSELLHSSAEHTTTQSADSSDIITSHLQPIHQRLTSESSPGPIVIFDTETTRRSIYQGRLTQIAALRVPPVDDAAALFNAMILPPHDVTPAITELTGIQTWVINGKRCLFKDGRMVDSVLPKKAVMAFLQWLPKNSVLCAHNCKRFDATVLWREVELAGQTERMCRKIAGLSDTLEVVRRKLPERKKFGLKALHVDLCGGFDMHHDATADVEALRDVLEAAGITGDDIWDATQQARTSLHTAKEKRAINKRFKTLAPLVGKRIISEYCSRYLAVEGFTYERLGMAYYKGAADGVFDILVERMAKRSRPHYILAVSKKLSNFFSTRFRPRNAMKDSTSSPT